MTDKPNQEDEAEPSPPSALTDDALPELPDYATVLEGTSFPDYATALSGINVNIPELLDYAKMLDGIKVPDYATVLEGINFPDYATALSGISFNIPELPDYVKLLGGIKVPDFATALDGINLNIPDYLKALDGLNFNIRPTKTENIVAPPVDQSEKLREEIATLRTNAAEHAKALRAATSGSEDQKREIERLKSTVDQLKEKQRLGFLLERVHPDAEQRLRESPEFQEKFLATGECSAFVLSVDIRRSTELMLKARTPEQFADFISGLCQELTAIVVKSLGVFDKFTGDGILAFFPDFYSGRDAAYRVLAAADGCHAAFERHYRGARTSFKSILADVGLGIGIDYGSVRLVQVAGGLTVVGEPVVYACRLSSAPPEVTLANQPAFEQITAKCGGLCFSKETNHEIKHEGKMLAYEVRLNGRAYVPAGPDWLAGSTVPAVPAVQQKST